MRLQRWVLLFVGVCAISALVGCGGGSSTTPPPAISVSFSTAPPASLQVTATAPVAATVANDSSNAGVDWSCAPAGACGSFSAAHTASGTATTYTAPASVPTGGTVTITATSTADNTKSVAATVTISVPVAISFKTKPPASMPATTSVGLSANVTGDPNNKGVDWTCAPAGSCGLFTPAHTASGVVTQYTAPSSGASVTVKATATADNTKSVSATINLTIYAYFYRQPTPFSLVNANNSITAVVADDSTNAGVDWTCTPLGTCGTFNPTHTTSGAATKYTAPGTPTSVTVTASATAHPATVATTTIAVATTFGNDTFLGNYVFQASGVDTHGPYRVTGTIVTDGNGNVTGGEQNYENLTTPGTYHDTFTGTYSISGTDGRGTVTLNTGDTNVGVGGTETLGLVVLDGTKGLITQFDISATSSGTIDLQTPASQLSGAYAFVVLGVNVPGKPLGFGGVFNIDSPTTGGISGTGSVSDDDDNGTVNTAQTLSGNVVAPDPLGKAGIYLTVGFTKQPITLIAYIVDNAHVKLVEQDSFGITAGSAFGQGAATGTFTNNSFNAPVVFETLGVSGSTPVPTAYAGLFTADGAGNITSGVADENAGGTVTSDGTLNGTYAVDSSKTGRATTSLTFNGTGSTPNWILYLTGDNNTPVLILQVDKTPTPIQTAGAAYTQSIPGGGFTAGSFSGLYGIGFTALPGSSEDDGTGQVSADGIGTLGTPGTVDVNYDFSPQSGQTLTGAFTAVANGRFTGTLTAGTVFLPSTMSFYIVDATRVVFIETDGTQPALGVFRIQQ